MPAFQQRVGGTRALTQERGGPVPVSDHHSDLHVSHSHFILWFDTNLTNVQMKRNVLESKRRSSRPPPHPCCINEQGGDETQALVRRGGASRDSRVTPPILVVGRGAWVSTACFHNPRLSTSFHEKVGIIALCPCTCVTAKSPLEFE